MILYKLIHQFSQNHEARQIKFKIFQELIHPSTGVTFFLTHAHHVMNLIYFIHYNVWDVSMKSFRKKLIPLKYIFIEKLLNENDEIQDLFINEKHYSN